MVARQPEQVGRLDVSKPVLGVVYVLLQLVHQRRELADGEVAAADVLVDDQRHPVHPPRSRVQQLVQVLEVALKNVDLQ